MALRLAALFVQPLQQSADFQWYYERAAGIVSGTGYAQDGVLTAFWPVGWPGALAALFTITGPSILAGQIANLVLMALVFWLTARFAAAAFRDRIIGRCAILLLVFYPNQIGYVTSLSTEIFYEAILLGGVLLLLRERFIPALLAGVIFGVATLTKAQSLFLPAVMVGCAFLAAPSKAFFVRSCKILCGVYITVILVVAPWTYRNYTVFHAFIPVSTNGGWTLLTGNNPQANGDYTPVTPLVEGITHDPADQVAMDQLARSRAVAWIKQNPLDFALLMPKKLFHLWAPDGESEWFYQTGFAPYDSHVLLFRSIRVLNQAYYTGIVLMALYAMWLLRRAWSQVSPWATAGLALCAYFSAISLVFSGQSRFHFALMPFIAIYAARGLVGMIRREGPTHASAGVWPPLLADNPRP